MDFLKKRNGSRLFFIEFPIPVVILALIFSGCAITLRPEFAGIPQFNKKPILRVGSITETVTGTWKIYPDSGFRRYVIEALNEPEAQSYFSNEMSNLMMNIDLVSDHEDDNPRLGNLGALSMVTLGIIPLNYFSEWNAEGEVEIVDQGGNVVAEYVFHGRASYEIWAFPLTMFALFGAGLRGEGDARALGKRSAHNFLNQIFEVIEKDYSKLAAYAGVQAEAQAAPTVAPPSLVV
ncbi:MAG: hypothetical protein Q8R76_06030 [Candidatus Omnitrophota bacterium]|nr:hypothetical protein [Candidatus Omnitrophota bacterium]